MIKPTVGRIVWYYPSPRDPGLNAQDEPLAAIVTRVHSDTCVNLAIFDMEGSAYGRTSVPLIQDDAPRPEYFFAEWMPYQKGQAAKTEALMDAAGRAGLAGGTSSLPANSGHIAPPTT